MVVLWTPVSVPGVLGDNSCRAMSPGTVWDTAGLLFRSVHIPLRDPLDEVVEYLMHLENAVMFGLDRRDSSLCSFLTNTDGATGNQMLQPSVPDVPPILPDT